jgi:hypothetical protein
MNCIPALPTLDEVPLLKEGVRDWEELLRIGMIPAEDAALRAAAIALHNKSEDGSRMAGGGPELTDDLKGLSSIPAKTVGGLAWKLSQVFNYYKPDEDGDWTWPAYLLQSALSDALDHARARGSTEWASTSESTISALFAEWKRLESTAGVSEEEMTAITARMAAIEHKLVTTTAATPAALLCKAKIIAHFTKTGQPRDPTTGEYDKKRDLIGSLIADLERLSHGDAA